MMMKLLMSWDIKTGRESHISSSSCASLHRNSCGSDCSRRRHGNCLRRRSPDFDRWRYQRRGDNEPNLASHNSRALRDQLSTYVSNFDQKVVQASGGFQL